MAINSIFIDALVRGKSADKLKRMQVAMIDAWSSGALQVAYEGNMTQFDSPEQMEQIISKIEVALQRIESGGSDSSVSNIVYADRHDRNYWL